MDTQEKQQIKPCESDLEQLGFTAAASGLKYKREIARKMRIAFEHFRVVTPENIQAFNHELCKRTRTSREGGGYTYQRLEFIPISEYEQVPPAAVLEALRAARELNCFDAYQVAMIVSQTVIPDPILFGIITGCSNKYYIAQWDDDVKIEDILKEDEG